MMIGGRLRLPLLVSLRTRPVPGSIRVRVSVPTGRKRCEMWSSYDHDEDFFEGEDDFCLLCEGEDCPWCGGTDEYEEYA
jgi:hypothetical protein